MVPSKVPTAFVSYSWDSDQHCDWVRALATRLRGDGVDVKLDQWSVVPGDNLPEFMERAVRENDFVLIVCTPRYKVKSDRRVGGTGYEGDIMTAEVFTTGNQRKFIPILREGEWKEAAPSWLSGKFYVDLHGAKYAEANYRQLLETLHGVTPQPPPLGAPPASREPAVTPPSPEQLLGLENKVESLLKELPHIRDLHLDHAENKEWRTNAERYFRQFDQLLPGDDFSKKYAFIAWHWPDKAADDSEEQRAIYVRACNNTAGLLKSALQALREKREEAQRDILAPSMLPSSIGASASGSQVNQQATGSGIAQVVGAGAATVNAPHVLHQLTNMSTPHSTRKLTQESRIKLRKNLVDHFTRSQLRDVCFDMNVDYGSLSGRTKPDDVRGLIAHCERTGRLDGLIAICSERRPDASWEVEYE